MSRRLHFREVERRKVLGVVEDHPELLGEAIELVAREREAREPSNVLHLGSRDARLGHGTILGTARPDRPERRHVRATIATRHRTGGKVAKHPFLSDEWFVVVEQLAEEHGPTDVTLAEVVMNVTVTDTPFGAERRLHLGVRAGKSHWGIGHVDDADATVTTDYETAKEIFVSPDPEAALQAFMAGRVVVQGDMAKLMAAQLGRDAAPALQEAIQGITL